jgi:hypothetical protein
MTIIEEINTKLENVEKTQGIVDWVIAEGKITNDFGDIQFFVFNTENKPRQKFVIDLLIKNNILSIKLNDYLSVRLNDDEEHLISKEIYDDIYKQCRELYKKNEPYTVKRNILNSINGYFNVYKTSLDDISLSFWKKIFSKLSFPKNELEYIFKHISNFNEVKNIYISTKG